MDNQNQYFAAKRAEDVASELMQRARTFYISMEANSYINKLVKMWCAYHGIYSDNTGFNQHSIQFTGEQGELVQLPVNHFRNIAEHILRLITSNRPTMEARAINTDYKSLAQTYLANGILDYYMRQRGLEEAIQRATEYSIVMGAGFVKLSWNATTGDISDYDEATGEVNYEGDMECTVLSPFDVVVDGTKETYTDDWILTRTWKNKYDLAAKYPEMGERIKELGTKENVDNYRLRMWSNDKTDDVAVYEFFHKKSEALPEGRYIQFLDRDIVLMDVAIPYRRVPVFRITPSEILGTPYGYTPMFDVYPIQEGINSLYSTIMTNQNAFGVQNIFVPRGSDIVKEALPGGLNILEANAKPEPLQLTSTPPEVFAFLKDLIQAAETISGVNSVVRGNPESSLKSGTALALVQSNALQFISGLQKSYIKLIENIGTSTIEILKDFANTPRIVEIVGKTKRPYLKEFSSDDISNINRVVVNVGNPLSKTQAGRVQMAEQLLQMQLITNPKQYFQVLNTGELETTFEGEMDELMLVKSENERLISGEDPIVSPLDKHSMHIMEHRAVLADPELRTDPELVRSVMDHIQKHLDFLRTTDPTLLALVGEQAAPPPMPAGMQMGQPSEVMQDPNAQLTPGEEIIASGDANKLPGLPTPPAPFETAPVTAQDMTA